MKAPKFKSEWTEADWRKAKSAIRRHFANQTVTNHEGKLITFASYFDAIDIILGLAYTSSSSYAMLSICNIQAQHDKKFHYSHFAINLYGNVIAVLNDNEENEQFIYLAGDLKAQIKEAFPKAEFDRHETDLYVKSFDGLTEYLKENYEHFSNITPFRSQVDKCQWLDIPFAAWNAKYPNNKSKNIA